MIWEMGVKSFLKLMLANLGRSALQALRHGNGTHMNLNEVHYDH